MPSSARESPEPAAAGALLRDKPAGVTSHDVVASVRRDLGVKAGHAGTLDPFATGLLIVLIGRATRLQRYLVGLPKTYLATARLGWRSTTGDPDGELRETGTIPARLELPTGRVEQRLPMTSAVRVAGERLYRKAHRGEEVETPTRTVDVHRATLRESDAGTATFEIGCSSGTYVRTLIETLEDAYCERLRRTAIGPFRIEDAGKLLAPNEALAFLPERALSHEEARGVANGVGVEVADRRSQGGGPWGGDRSSGPSRDTGRPGGTPAPAPEPATCSANPVRLTHGGRLLAVARERNGMLRPEVVLS